MYWDSLMCMACIGSA